MRAASIAARIRGKIGPKMSRDSAPAAPGDSPLPRPLGLFHILAIVLLWNCSYAARARKKA